MIKTIEHFYDQRPNSWGMVRAHIALTVAIWSWRRSGLFSLRAAIISWTCPSYKLRPAQKPRPSG